MKKLLLGLSLIAVLVGVSYVKSIRGQSAKQEAHRQGVRESSIDLSVEQQRVDSLRQVITFRELEFADSMTAQQIKSAVIIDSLEDISRDQTARISDLQSKLQTTQKTASAKAKSDDSAARERKILDYYKGRYARLPGDLTEYEMRVALNEIRDETAKKFSITTGQLKTIRASHGLSY